MSNTLHNLQSSQAGTVFSGKFILVGDFGTTSPDSIAESAGQGFGTGALAINTHSGSLSGGERIFINAGDATTSNWVTIICAG